MYCCWRIIINCDFKILWDDAILINVLYNFFKKTFYIAKAVLQKKPNKNPGPVSTKWCIVRNSFGMLPFSGSWFWREKECNKSKDEGEVVGWLQLIVVGVLAGGRFLLVLNNENKVGERQGYLSRISNDMRDFAMLKSKVSVNWNRWSQKRLNFFFLWIEVVLALLPEKQPKRGASFRRFMKKTRSYLRANKYLWMLLNLWSTKPCKKSI